ncbi:MAG: response regulator [Candidatus Sumerlaeia bacterium]|nr:response regulator [Candidatus Sumerlaeia bacterium]
MNKKILLVDDEPDVLQMLKATLMTRNYEILTASAGDEGLEIAERERPDLILCDLMMPRVSGLEFLKRMRKSQKIRDTPIIIISAIGASDRPPEYWVRTLGVDDYLQKPFDPLDLLGRVEYIFRRRNYVSTTRSEEEGTGSSELDTQLPVDLTDAPPVEVVRAFIESWNRQDFATEYSSMGEEMIGTTPLHDYVNRRRQMYFQESGNKRRQRVVNVVEEKISLNVAKVVVDREDDVSGEITARRETYSLKKTHKGWKIINCRVARS